MMQNIFLSIIGNVKYPEVFYVFAVIFVMFALILFIQRTKLTFRKKLLYLNKLIILFLLSLIISNPMQNAPAPVTDFVKYRNVYYIDNPPLNQTEFNEFLKNDAEIMNAPIILRLGDTKYVTSTSDLQNIVADYYSNSAIDENRIPFEYIEPDVATFCTDIDIENLTLLSSYAPSSQQITKLQQYCSKLTFIPLSQTKPMAELRVNDFSVNPNKLSVMQPFTAKISLNEAPAEQMLAEISINDTESKSVSINSIDTTVVFPGFNNPGVYKINLDLMSKIITKTILVEPLKNVFIFRGNTDLETQSDIYLSETLKNINVNSTINSTFPADLDKFNAGFMRLSQILMLTESEREKLENWVANGAGLFVSYGEDIQLSPKQLDDFKNFLPAEPLLQKESEKSDTKETIESDADELVARVSILLMIDNSGSMASDIGGTTRFEYVKTAAKKMVENLDPEDFVGICSFNSDVSIELPLVPARNKELIYRKIDNIKAPGWQTSLRGACESAVNIFSKDRSAVKQLIILSDGEETVEPQYNFGAIRKKLIEGNINTSVIGFGEYNPEMLASLVTKGGQRYFQSREKDDQGFYVHKLPEFILADVKLAKDYLKENYSNLKPNKDNFDDLNKALPQLVQTGTFPTFWAYNPFSDDNFKLKKVMRFVEMYNFASCYTILGVNYEDVDFPLISARNFDRGKILAFAGDFNAHYVPDFFNWEQFQKLIANLVEFLVSQNYRGIELVEANFIKDGNEANLLSEISTQNADFDTNLLKLRIVDNKNVNTELNYDLKSDVNSTILRLVSKIDPKLLTNVQSIICEYDTQIFDIINIPDEFTFNHAPKTATVIPQKVEGFIKTSNRLKTKTPITFETLNLSLITLLLALSAILYMLDVFLRR